MIDFVVAFSMICDAVFVAVNLLPHFLRNIAHLFGLSRHTEILSGDVECIARRQFRVGNNRGGLLAEAELGDKP